MKKRTERSMLVLVAVFFVAYAAQMTFLMTTERRRVASLAKIREPLSIAAHRRLAAKLSAERTAASSVGGPESERTDNGVVLLSDAFEVVESYKRLFDLIQNVWGIPRDGRWEWTQDESEFAKVTRFLDENRELIQEIRLTAARGGPAFPVDFSRIDATQLPESIGRPLFSVLKLARLLRVDAVAKATERNYPEAIEDIIAGMQLADALAQEPILEPQLTRWRVYSYMIDTIQRFFRGGDVPPELVDKLVDHMAYGDGRHAFAECFFGEQARYLQTFSAVREGRLILWRWPPEDRSSFVGRLPRQLYESPLGGPWRNLDEVRCVGIVNRIVTAAKLPYYEARPQLEQIEQDLPRTRVLTRSLLQSLREVCPLQGRHEAVLDLTRMGLLLEQYQAWQGSYPETLDAIAPSLGGTVPVDPFTGQSYHYHPSGDSFLLYSVGPNLADNGGKHDLYESDIVWRGTRTDD